MENILQEQFDYYKAHQKELIEKYEGKVIVIRDLEVIGVYDSELEAVLSTEQDYELGTFHVQRVSNGTNDYTVTIYSYLMNAPIPTV